MKAIRLKVNGLCNPIGIDAVDLAFSWNLEEGKMQTAYEIRTAASEQLLSEDYTSTGKLFSSSMCGHLYEGERMSRKRVYWSVRIWDENDAAGPWSKPAWFEFGLLKESDWKAEWICGDYEPVLGIRYPADYFRKVFTLTRKPVRARIYSTACGVYVNRLNGAKCGDEILAPGRTTYEKRLHYQTCDVTEQLCVGENTWSIVLGDGWFRGKSGAFGASYIFGARTAYLGQLELTYEDGESEIIASENSFDWCNDGPVRMNDMKDFGILDMNCSPSYRGKAKKTEYHTCLCCSNNVLVREKEHFKPNILKTPDGSTVLDFGQNIAGYIKFSVQGAKGEKVRLLLGEMLDEQGNFTNHNLVTLEKNDYIPDYCDDSHFQELEVILSGERDEIHPELTVHGFQYVLLKNWPEEVIADNFTAIAVYSDMEYLADFTCSDKEIEKLVENTLWSIKGNYLDVPTDCPTRERSAWLGDAQLFFDTSCYFVDGEAFYRKWVRDIFDDQADSGLVYNIVPRCAAHEGMNLAVEGSSGWVDAGILIPYRYYREYRNSAFLKEIYPKLKKLAEYMLSRMGDESNDQLDQLLPKHELRKFVVTTGFHFGEWNEPGATLESIMAPKFEVATAYLAYSLFCMAEIAEITGHEEDALYYKNISEKVKEAYRFYFVNEDMDMPKRMCEYIRPIALNLVPEKDKVSLGRKLSTLVKEHEWHVGTGFLSTPFLLMTVDRYCSQEDAWKMLENRAYPSWLAEVAQGATTVWENWEGIASRNHYSNGAVCDWIFGNACGIRVTGENRFSIAPEIGGNVSSMEFSYLSRYGKVVCGWKKSETGASVSILIPAGTTAEILLPGRQAMMVEAGEYLFEEV